MTVESLRCPNCGSTLSVPPSRGFTVCDYCGSHLRVTRDSAGHPVGVLDDIRLDTSLLAKERALAHLQERLSTMEREHDELAERMRVALAGVSTRSSVGPWIPGIILGFFACVLFSTVDATLAMIAALAVVLGLGWLLSRHDKENRRRRSAEIERRYAPRLAELDDEVAAVSKQIERLKRDIDELAMRM